MITPEVGAEASVELLVTAADTAARLSVEAGEVYPDVLATRIMVGVRVEVEHTVATPVGARVVSRARYLGMEGKLHLFAVEAFDLGRIGQGRHARAVVDEARLLAGADRRHN